jgi:hypothetical protein
MFSGFSFELLTLFILGNHNFFNYISFLTIFNAPIGGVQGFFDTKTKEHFPWIWLALSV